MLPIGVDVGGTFADFTLLDERTRELSIFKLPSRPADPSDAIEAGLGTLLEMKQASVADVS